jgi:2'-5' RNA ligase
VGRWRLQYDTSATSGVGAHITLLSPFLAPERLTPEVVRDLTAFFQSRPPLSLEFGGICAFPNVVYLPPEPQATIREIIIALAEAYPEAPPYMGAMPLAQIVPHVAVALSPPAAIEDLPTIATAFCRDMEGKLPIHVVLREALLVAQEGDGVFRTKAILPFGGS